MPSIIKSKTLPTVFCVIVVSITCGRIDAAIRVDGTQIQGASFGASIPSDAGLQEKQSNNVTPRKIIASFAQPMVAQAGVDPDGSSNVVKIGLGYQYNLHQTAYSCLCPHQGDVYPISGDADGIINAMDVMVMIDYVFRSGAAPPSDEPRCPRVRGDFANGSGCGNGYVNVVDVIALIDYVFRSGPPPCDPCAH